jgi:hypothetical protein
MNNGIYYNQVSGIRVQGFGLDTDWNFGMMETWNIG